MIGKVIFGVVGGVAVMVAIGSQLHPRTPPIVNEFVLIDYAKEDIRVRLNDPDWAQFGEAQYAKDGRIICIPTHARNGFGGHTGTQIICVPGRTLVEDVQVDKEPPLYSNAEPAEPGSVVVRTCPTYC